MTQQHRVVPQAVALEKWKAQMTAYCTLAHAPHAHPIADGHGLLCIWPRADWQPNPRFLECESAKEFKALLTEIKQGAPADKASGKRKQGAW